MYFCAKSSAFPAIAVGLVMCSSGCAYENALLAEKAKTSLVGMSELELETSLGVADKKAATGKTTLLTYSALSARTVDVSIPIINGIGMSIQGNCRATFRLENGRVAEVSYTGDGDPFEGRNSACGSLMRACLSRRG